MGMGDDYDERIGMLTSSGDCQSLNATMRSVVKVLTSLREMLRFTASLMGIKD